MNLLAPVRTVVPQVTPVSLEEAKEHLRDTFADEDALILGLINAATAHLDGWHGILRRALVTQTWRQDFPGFPGCYGWRYGRMELPGDYGLRLPLAPVQSITSVTYRDSNNAVQTFDPMNYVLLEDALGPFVTLAPGYTGGWPGTYLRSDAVSVTFVAGYGAAADVPEPIKAAMKLMISHWFNSREAIAFGGSPTEVPMTASYLLMPYRRVFSA